MVGQIRLIAALVLAGAWFTSIAQAQDGDAPSPRPLPSLSERLQQFRQDLWGDSPNGSNQNGSNANNSNNSRNSGPDGRFGADRKAGLKPRPTLARPRNQNGAPQAEAAADQQVPPAAQPRPMVTKLQAQDARRAQGGAPLSATTIEPVDRSTQELAPGRPPVAKSAEPPAETEEADAPEEKAPRMANTVSPKKTAAENVEKGPASGVLFTAQSPVLSVEATGPRKMLIGKEAQFVVKMHNAGTAANNVVVTVNIPSYVEVVSAQASSGAAQVPIAGERREPLEWRVSRFEAKSSETLNLKLVPRKSTPIDLAVQWTFTPESSQTLVEVQEPKLAMTIVGPDEVLFGQSKIYKLTVSNPGNGDSENVIVGLMPIGRSADGTTNHRLGTLRAGESKTIDVELTAHQAGVLTIKAQAFAEGGLRTEAAEQVLVRRASLQIEVEAPRVKYAGTVGTYHLKLINAGNATAENVQVSAMLPPEAKYVNSSSGGRLDAQQGKVNWTVGTLQPGGQRVFELHCSLHAPGENRMQFATMADGDLSSAATSATRVEALADLKLEVRDPQGPIAIGEDAIYEVHIRNRGTKAADDIDLAVFFSEGLEATSVEGGPHDISRGQVIFKPITTLGPGETATLRVHTAAEKPGTHVFRAEVICRSLQTKLATEETTHFYGDDRPSAPVGSASEPQPASPDEPAGDAGSEQPDEAPAESGQ